MRIRSGHLLVMGLLVSVTSVFLGCSPTQSGSSIPPAIRSATTASATDGNSSSIETTTDGMDSRLDDKVSRVSQEHPSVGAIFQPPVRIKAGGEFVAVESPGYACPTMADVDGDGLRDLVVGQFNSGNLQFYKNVAGPGEPPKFAAAEWLKTGDERATVPGVW